MKAVAWVIGLVVLLVLGVGGYLAFFSGSLIKTAIEEFGPDYLGTNIAVDSVDLSLTEGSGGVRGLVISNPPGFEGPHAMKLKEIVVSLDPNRIGSDLVVIKSMSIDGADVLAVANGKSTNFQKIMDNVAASTSGDGEQSASTTTAEGETRFIVEKFSFTNAKVAMNSDVLGAMDLTIPDIHLSEVGKKSNGATAAELAEELLKPITSAISKAAVSQGLDLDGVRDNVEKQIKDKLGDKLGGLRGLTDKLKK